TQTEVADRLHLSERSLRRRLAAESTSYRKLLNQVRETLARAYLLDTGLRVEEIAERLGYSDAANFSHAFRRWTGTSPGRFRSGARPVTARRQS
ncbi:MAG: helix-turn-helix transcriptional regulator, partial [Gammaproteobacteria bacterium]